MEKISIIIPAYNAEKYICDSIYSAINQTYTNTEIIVIDDGSTDTTSCLVNNISKKHNNLIYTYQDNGGPASARNNGIKIASGKYIAFLDADDIWNQDFLIKLYDMLITAKSAGFSYCDNIYVDLQRKPIDNYSKCIDKINGNITLALFCKHFLFVQAILLKRECIDSIGLFDSDLIVGEDYDFLLRLAINYNAAYVDDKLWERRVVPGSLSRQNFVLDAKNDLFTLKNFLRQHPEFHVNNLTDVNLRLSDYHFSFGYNCLQNKMNYEALKQFMLSVKYKPSVKAFKNMILCSLPHSVRTVMKSALK